MAENRWLSRHRIHAYATIDDEVVWDIVQHKVPQLLEQIERILAPELDDGA